MEPDKCILDSFRMVAGMLELNFQNGSRAHIRGKNPEGQKEIGMISEKLNDLMGESYTEILEIDF